MNALPERTKLSCSKQQSLRHKESTVELHGAIANFALEGQRRLQLPSFLRTSQRDCVILRVGRPRSTTRKFRQGKANC